LVANGVRWPKVDVYFAGALVGFATDEMGDLYIHALPESRCFAPQDLLKVAVVIREALDAGNVEQPRKDEPIGEYSGILPWNIANVRDEHIVERVRNCNCGYAYI
jgi:hypothetical protein